jgi:hypothetical protein
MIFHCFDAKGCSKENGFSNIFLQNFYLFLIKSPTDASLTSYVYTMDMDSMLMVGDKHLAVWLA